MPERAFLFCKNGVYDKIYVSKRKKLVQYFVYICILKCVEKSFPL